jgi:hypothetical protein
MMRALHGRTDNSIVKEMSSVPGLTCSEAKILVRSCHATGQEDGQAAPLPPTA